jgi:hypothetical protein
MFLVINRSNFRCICLVALSCLIVGAPTIAFRVGEQRRAGAAFYVGEQRRARTALKTSTTLILRGAQFIAILRSIEINHI